MGFMEETVSKINEMEKQKEELFENLPDNVPAVICNVEGDSDEDPLYRGDVFADEEGNVKFGNINDRLIHIEFEIMKDGRVAAEGDQYLEINSKEKGFFRRFIRTYGVPEDGMDILVSYNHEKEKWYIRMD